MGQDDQYRSFLHHHRVDGHSGSLRNREQDGSPQLKKMAIVLDPDTRRLYEAILYEPLRRVMQATQDPDYLYTINDADPMADRSELYDFWARTLIADIDDFNIPDSKKILIARRQRKMRDASTPEGTHAL